MSSLIIKLFGPPQIELDGTPIDLGHNKPVALLAYLAVTQTVHTRQTLATLFWPEYGQARAYLRNNLAIIRRAFGNDYANWLQLDRNTAIGFRPEVTPSVDVLTFSHLARGCPAHAAGTKPHGTKPEQPSFSCTACATQWMAALDLYRADFLDGFTLRDSPAFDEWCFFQREELRRQKADLLETLVRSHVAQQNLAVALQLAQRWVKSDPLHEAAHRHLMQLYAWLGREEAALRQYQECVRVLAQELDVPPEPQTEQLFMAIKEKRLFPLPPSATAATSPVTGKNPAPLTLRVEKSRSFTPRIPLQPSNLPHPVTSLIGRRQEGATLVDWLIQPEIRLVTLTGTGGVGKTRLALQVAAQLQSQFRDGAYFVPLAPLRDLAQIPLAIGDILGVREVSDQSHLRTLQAALRDRQLLLLLDNYEHLLTAASLVSDLLTSCPQIKVLITSREMLNVRGEHEFILPPLSLPTQSSLHPIAELARLEAIQLFIQRAQSVNTNFVLDEQSAPAVAEICTRLDGLPLALELAAAQIKHFAPQVLNNQLAQYGSLQRLQQGTRDMPVRHQTLRQALAWSVNLLTPSVRRIFCRLGIFVGGFTLDAVAALCNDEFDTEQVFKRSMEISRFARTAAARKEVIAARNNREQVASDLRKQLLDLVNKSLVRQEFDVDGKPRFFVLETIREYALELLQKEDDIAACQRKHTAFYLTLAIEAESELDDTSQLQWLPALTLEHNNFRAALNWTITNEQIDIAMRIGVALYPFWLKKGYSQEAGIYLAQIHAMREMVGASLVAGEFYFALAMTSDHRRGSVTAQTYFAQSLEMSRTVGNDRQAAYSLSLLCYMTYRRGDYQQADAYRTEAHKLYRALNDEWGYYFGMGNWGVELAQCGQLETGRKRCEEALAKLRELGDEWGMGVTLLNVANVAMLQGDWKAARNFIEEGATVANSLAHQSLIASANHLTAKLLLQQDNAAAASELLSDAVIPYYPPTSHDNLQAVFETYVALYLRQNEPLSALQLAAMLTAQRAADGIVLPPLCRQIFAQMVTTARQQVDAAAADLAWAKGETMTMEDAITLVTYAQNISNA